MIGVVGAAALLSAALAAGAAARPADVAIRVVSTATSVRTHAVAPKGPSVGDYVVLDDRLTNAVRQFGKPRGASVGSDHAVERLVPGGGLTIDGLARLPGDTIRFKRRVQVDTRGHVTAPVVEGTGKYAGAHGTVAITNLRKDGSVALNVYRLTLLPVS